MKKHTYLTLALVVCITMALRAEVKTSAVDIGSTTPVAARKAPTLADLQKEYEQTVQQITELQAHALRLEGAISVLQMQDATTTAAR